MVAPYPGTDEALAAARVATELQIAVTVNIAKHPLTETLSETGWTQLALDGNDLAA